MPKKSSKFTKFSPRFVPGIKSQKWAKKATVDAQKLQKNLEAHRDKAIEAFEGKHPHADKWLKTRNIQLGQIRVHSRKLLTGASLSAALMLAAPISPQSLPQKPSHVLLAEAGISPLSQVGQALLKKLSPLIPKRIGHLDPATETKVQKLLQNSFGITATSTLEDQRLNHSLGWIGYEQHLRRFPGDNLSQHDEERRSGIAPGLGAWGYFTSSKGQLDENIKLYEKYYVAVQTLYIPTWQKDLKFLRDWYKHRKVLVVDVDSGRAVVAVIGDAGPAAWTGKQFGGSPELMRALDLTGKKSKGKVLLLFVDDPQNRVPLGPLQGKVGDVTKLT